MKIFCTTTLAILFSILSLQLHAQFCNGNGNVIIFTNYDGGHLTINVDQNIPNLKIGVCSYEAVTINITGPYSGNVTEVIYAGFDSNNTHCGANIPATTITGVSSSITSILFAPPATLSDPDGYGSIICAYGCGAGNQGGCNTAIQVLDYFLDQFGGSLLMYYSQYGCWPVQAKNVSDGGNCCPGVAPEAPIAEFEMSADTICPGDCIELTDMSLNNPDSYSWIFNGGSPESANGIDPGTVCYETPGTYTIWLTVTNEYGTGTEIKNITVDSCPVLGCMYPNATNYNPEATIDDLSCTFECDTVTTCAGDFNGDSIVGVADLLVFISLYGTVCP